MWSETVGLKSSPVWDQKNRSWSWSCRSADVVLWNMTRSCYTRRHNDLDGRSNFSSTIYSFFILCLEHHYCGDQRWRLFTWKLNSSSAFVYFRWSWSCYFGLCLGLDLKNLVLFTSLNQTHSHMIPQHCYYATNAGQNKLTNFDEHITSSAELITHWLGKNDVAVTQFAVSPRPKFLTRFLDFFLQIMQTNPEDLRRRWPSRYTRLPCDRQSVIIRKFYRPLWPWPFCPKTIWCQLRVSWCSVKYFHRIWSFLWPFF